jgi:hypothetical protein
VLGQVDELWAALTLVFGDEDIEQRPSSSCGVGKSATEAVQEGRPLKSPELLVLDANISVFALLLSVLRLQASF